MRVINRKTATPEEMKTAVYIGRPSPLKNPYPMDKEEDRDRVVDSFECYFVKALLRRIPVIETAFRALTPDSVLMCFCAPLRCHGDVIAKIFTTYFIGQDYDASLEKLKLAYQDILKNEPIFFDPKEDGVTHINVWSKGKTELGRLLSNFAHTPISHDEYGHFASIEGLWYWLSLGKRHEELRKLFGYEAKKHGQLLRYEDSKDIFKSELSEKAFELEIKRAILMKIEQNDRLRELLKVSTLPLAHYYVWGDGEKVKITNPTEYAWTYQYVELVRQWLNGEAVKLLIAGSRGIKDTARVHQALLASGYNPVEIISGMAHGVDTCGVEIARTLGIPVKKYPVTKEDWDTLGNAAGYLRNEKMGDYCEAAVILWDGQSRGTKGMISYMTRIGKPYFLVSPKNKSVLPRACKIKVNEEE